MKYDKTALVLKKLENRFKMGPAYLAACGNKLDRIRLHDMFYSAANVYLDADEDVDDIYVHDFDYESLIILTACFMMDMAFELCLRYNANVSMVTDYVMGKVWTIARQMGLMEIIPDVHAFVAETITQRQRVYVSIANQKANLN